MTRRKRHRRRIVRQLGDAAGAALERARELAGWLAGAPGAPVPVVVPVPVDPGRPGRPGPR